MLIHLKRMLVFGIMLAGIVGPLHAMDAEKDKLNKRFMHAVELKGINRILDLINKGADVNYQSTDSRSALETAAMLGNPEVVRLLIEKGANAHHQDENGNTALTLAKWSSSSEIEKEISIMLVKAMLKLTKEQKDSVYALIASLERTPSLQTSKDTRRLIVQALIDAYRKENLAKTRAEIEKKRDSKLKNQLLQLLEK